MTVSGTAGFFSRPLSLKIMECKQIHISTVAPLDMVFKKLQNLKHAFLV